MRRHSVHRVLEVVVGVRYTGRYRTACGITGGADLLALAGINNGTGHWCGGCYPSRNIDPRSTSRWQSRWTHA